MLGYDRWISCHFCNGEFLNGGTEVVVNVCDNKQQRTHRIHLNIQQEQPRSIYRNNEKSQTTRKQ